MEYKLSTLLDGFALDNDWVAHQARHKDRVSAAELAEVRAKVHVLIGRA